MSSKRTSIKKIRSAYDKGITIFCAASNEVKANVAEGNEDKPAASKGSVKIGAATAEGEPYK